MTTTTDEPISVVLVEDDDRLAKLTARYLESHGVTVTIVSDGRAAVSQIVKVRPDVVLLDLMLPGLSGLDVCREVRARSDVPILMVTARGEEADRVVGLEGGADDYIAKPFSSRELLARVRAHARRARGGSGPAKRSLQVGRLVIDVDAMHASLDGVTLALTTYEFMLLRALAERAGRVLTREQLVDIVRGSAEEAFDRSVDVHVSHLRAKLGDDPRSPRIIKTVRGVGYMLALERG
ncbi:MAG: response regulator transcription factor [Labilithrix sp.]|nr:response regulator transcription factor [Labilithrix sp.]MCW5832535.1 response regulator transcription factor [Labilithrix sp.]